MAIKVNFNNIPIQKPGLYGPPPSWHAKFKLLIFLYKLNIRPRDK